MRDGLALVVVLGLPAAARLRGSDPVDRLAVADGQQPGEGAAPALVEPGGGAPDLQEGFLGDLSEVAGPEGWDNVIPAPLQAFAKYDGHYVAAPVNIHRPNWLWSNAKIFKDNGLTPPKTWE